MSSLVLLVKKVYRLRVVGNGKVRAALRELDLKHNVVTFGGSEHF